jgi:hypothetical protein
VEGPYVNNASTNDSILGRCIFHTLFWWKLGPHLLFFGYGFGLEPISFFLLCLNLSSILIAWVDSSQELDFYKFFSSILIAWVD